MSDYLEIPKAANSTNEGFYQNGRTLFSREGIGDWKIAYTGSSDYELRVGVYKHHNPYTGVDTHFFIVMSPVEIPYQQVDIRVVSPTFVTLFNYSEVTLDSVFGWWGTKGKDIDGFSTNLTVFDNLEDTQEAVGFGETPSGDSGVVVTCIGTPLAPDNNGVIVYCTGQLIDPNQQGGTSTPGGGTGTFDDTSDPIPYPILPDISAADVGLITLFRPTKSELQALGRVLWTNITDFIENLNKIFVNPMDYVISLNVFPCVPDVGESREIKIGSWTSDIHMAPVLSQWYTHNCGTIRINEYWGSALDYAPNTKISIFLPFIGSVSLNTDEVMGRTISLKYNIDLLSGQCVAMIAVDDSVWYQFTGECSVSIPLTASDWSRIYTAAVGAVGTAIAGSAGIIAAGGSGTAMAAFGASKAAKAASSAGNTFARLASTHTRGVQDARDAILAAMNASAEAAQNAASAPTQVGAGIRASRIANTVNNTVGQVMSGKGYVQHSGTVSGSAGLLGVKVPYIIIEFPNQSLADNYKHFTGYPSNMSGKLNEFTGYTECEQVIPNGFTGTDDELAELLEALKGGVYL